MACLILALKLLGSKNPMVPSMFCTKVRAALNTGGLSESRMRWQILNIPTRELRHTCRYALFHIIDVMQLVHKTVLYADVCSILPFNLEQYNEHVCAGTGICGHSKRWRQPTARSHDCAHTASSGSHIIEAADGCTVRSAGDVPNQQCVCGIILACFCEVYNLSLIHI